MEQINPEYHKIKLEVLLSELNECLERTRMDDPSERVRLLEKITRKHTITLANYGHPSIISSVPINIH